VEVEVSHRAGLGLGLAALGFGLRIRHDPRAGLDGRAAGLQDHGPDRDAEVEVAGQVEVAQRAAVEPAARGLYGGALGYLDLGGNLDFCIAIRTIVMEGGRATVQAGAGIVADSDPRAELAETEAKAGAMRAALRLAAAL
jgi:hypothetical protein